MTRPKHCVTRLGAGLTILANLALAAPALAASAAPVVLTRSSEGVKLPPEPVLGFPRPWEIGLQPGYSPVKRDMISLNSMVLWIIVVITIFVAGLLVWVMWRYSAKRNPHATQTAHNTFLEIAWTLVPILILVAIAIPSFRLVFFENNTAHPKLIVNVTAHQWYWEYSYPEAKGLDFISSIVPGDKLKAGQARLLTAANPLVLPVGENVRFVIASSDVIHSFFIPSLGVQRYAIPGRVIQTWVRIDKPGIYEGECNQICGTNHSRMPIDIVAVTPAQFRAWETQAAKQASAALIPARPAPQMFAETTEFRR